MIGRPNECASPLAEGTESEPKRATFMTTQEVSVLNAMPAAAALQQGGWRPLCLPALAQIMPLQALRAGWLQAGPPRLGRLIFACMLFAVILPTEIAQESELFVSRRIFGVPPHYAITAIVLLAALAQDLRYYGRLLSRPVVILGLACLGYVLWIGVLRHGMRSPMVRADLYIIRWFFVGFALMRMAITSGRLSWYFLFVTGVMLFTMYSLDQQATLGYEIDTSTKRVVKWGIYPLASCGTIMISMAMMCMWPRSRILAQLFTAGFALLAFGTAIRTSTRSSFVLQAFCLLLVLIALSRDARMKGRGQQLRRAGIILAFLFALIVIVSIATGRFLAGYTQLDDRFESIDLANDGTFQARVMEATELLRSLSADEWLLGNGLGGMFYTALGYWSNTPHIAVLGWLHKGGLVIAAVVIYCVYLKPSLRFAAALSRDQRCSPIPPPIQIVGPSLMAWLALTLISGGVDNGSFYGLGGLTALWMQLATDERVANFAYGFAPAARRIAVSSPWMSNAAPHSAGAT